ncbi:hypothetical protein ACJMK2_043934 [Sinanodonta woodiana]|uniref:Uncharacterized protein n=1 Tax=Sinanodonta woodiana TaxID=1069815 RepID=A0ABD3VZQ6_SINWO
MMMMMMMMMMIIIIIIIIINQIFCITVSAILPSTDETTHLHTEEPLFFSNNSKDRTKDSNKNSAFTTLLHTTPGSKVSGWTNEMKQENTTHMSKKNETSTRDTDIREKNTSYRDLDHDMKTRKSDVIQSTHDSDDIAFGPIPSAHSEMFSSTKISSNTNITEHTKASDSLQTSISTRKPHMSFNDAATNTGSSTYEFHDKTTSPYDIPIFNKSTVGYLYTTQELEKYLAASTTVTTHKETTHKEIHISANTAVFDRTTNDLLGATTRIETTRENDLSLPIDANARTSASPSNIKLITMTPPSTLIPKSTPIKVTTHLSVQTKPSTIQVTTSSIVNPKPVSKSLTSSSAVDINLILPTRTTPSTVKLKPATIKMTTPSTEKTYPATVKMATHSVVKQGPATTMMMTTSTVKPKQTSTLISDLKSAQTTMMIKIPSVMRSKMVTTLSSVQPKPSTIKVITPSDVQTKQAAKAATSPLIPEQTTTFKTVTTPRTIKTKPTTIMVTKHSTVKPISTTIIMITTLKPMAEAEETTSVEMNAPTHNRTLEEHISHTTVKSGVSNNTFSLDVTSTIGYSGKNKDTKHENTTAPLSTEALESSNTIVSPTSSTMLPVLQWATGFTQTRKPGFTSNPLQNPDKLQIQQPTINPFLDDDTYWPVAMALTIGIPSIIVFAVTITVLHRMRKSKFMGANMYRTL